jgi:ubiquitin carboxyl-terminal hydrolase 4/11/15
MLDPPNCLLVTLKRFKREGHMARKNTKTIKNNMTLNLSDFVLHEENKPTSCQYNLVGFTSHGGSLGGGHYTAYVQNDGK